MILLTMMNILKKPQLVNGNGSPELFDYYIFVYKDKPIATQYIR